MRARNIIGGTVLGFAALFMTAPAAFAETANTIDVAQGQFKPGDEVRISGKCFTENLKQDKFHSAALDSPRFIVKEIGDKEFVVFAETKVRKDAKNGKHEVWYMCGKDKVVGHVTVKGAAPAKPQPKPSGQVEAKPKGAADTGGGATEAVAAPTQPESTNYTAIGLGGAGALAAAGVGVLAFRRSRRTN